jgi:methyltransferase (TIGR00027 family)
VRDGAHDVAFGDQTFDGAAVVAHHQAADATVRHPDGGLAQRCATGDRLDGRALVSEDLCDLHRSLLTLRGHAARALYAVNVAPQRVSGPASVPTADFRARGPEPQLLWWDGAVKSDVPSLTARGVALARASYDRPSSPTGDPAAERRLAESLAEGIDMEALQRRRNAATARGDDGFLHFLVLRTGFFDEAVVRALNQDVRQVVILGAGYDARALRFHTPGVRFFEVDHPATQADKRARLEQVGASLDGITFVAADFTEPGLAGALAAAGHDPSQRSQFLCEGVLRYLPEHWVHELLRVAAQLATPASELAVSISTRGGEPRAGDDERRRALAEQGEPVLTVPERDIALRWVADAGWTVLSVSDGTEADPPSPYRLLVRAGRTQ